MTPFQPAANAPRRAAGIGFVLGLHLLLGWGLLHGLAHKVVEVLPEPIFTKILEEPPPPLELPPPPPEPRFEQPPQPLYVPPPELNIAPPEPPPAAITQIVREPPPEPAPPPRHVPQRVGPQIDFDGSPLGCRKPDYPPASRRLGEEGVSAISVLVDVDGKVKDSRVDAGSGSERLDRAAIRAFSLCHFSVGTVDGKPEPSWFSVRYQWQMTP